MTRIRMCTAIAASVAGMAMSTVAIGGASAAPSKWQPLHEEGGPFVHEDFCEVSGLTVEESFVVDGRFRLKDRGDRVPAYTDFTQTAQVWTNVATGEVVTNMAKGHSYEKVTNNRDGTLTVISKNVGNVAFYDGDGQRIGRVAGQLFSFALLFDHAGTPSDPSDDILLEFTDLGGKLIPAFCGIVVPGLT